MPAVANSDSVIRQTLREWMLALLLVLALLLGGGGSPSPATELALQLAFSALAVVAVWAGPYRSPAGFTAWSVAGLLVLVPATQLVPLPPSVWTALPGRELVANALDLIGAVDQWRPTSIAPHRTLASLLALGPPLVIMILTASSSDRALHRACWAIIVMAILAAILGTVQVASAGTAGHFYEATHRGWVTGFFANRNAAADLFVIAIIAALAIGRAPKGPRATPVPLGGVAAIVLLLSVAAIMTGSRVGIALLAVVAGCSAIWFAVRSLRLERNKASITGIVTIAGVGGLGAIGWLAGGLRKVGARFGASGDMRAQIWPDTWHAIEQFWPVGSGLGTFPLAFAPSQRLESLGPVLINRAHNDFLELALEGGAAALVILAAITLLLARNTLIQWRANAAIRPLLVFAGASLCLLAVHSAVDYPLRSMALAVICAFGAGIMAKPARMS